MDDTSKDRKSMSAQEIVSMNAIVVNRKSFLIATAVILMAAVFLSIVFSKDIATALMSGSVRVYEPNYLAIALDSYTSQIRIFSGVLGIITLGLITYLYTSGYLSGLFKITPREKQIDGRGDINIQTLAAMIDSVQKSAEDIRSNRHITSEDRSVITDQLKDIVRSSIPTEVFAAIDKKYGNSVKSEFVSEIMEEKVNLMKNRLEKFQANLSKKASAALSWGVTTAVIGIFLLGAFIYSESHPQSSDNVSIIFYYTMRISLVSMIEVVAFFFLRHYKSTLIDEKYVSNEITNIEMKVLSAISALKMGNAATSSKIFIELSKTERNFSLKKGETSIFHSATGSDMLPTNVVSDIFGKTANAFRGGKN
ncbi:hypothetical protein [Azospirillum cavernae]|uniref:hypothetical protein n=1 Tax=Azospirillum cavernae TaxID=2320860 RepID=UPI0011C4186A|nr:hypothetical protein [Azospirillum cavernae]